MSQKNNLYHIPVLLDACINGLNINPDGVYVDVTFGGGGHSRLIHSQLSAKGKLYALDQDKDALLMSGKHRIFILYNQISLFFQIS